MRSIAASVAGFSRPRTVPFQREFEITVIRSALVENSVLYVKALDGGAVRGIERSALKCVEHLGIIELLSLYLYPTAKEVERTVAVVGGEGINELALLPKVAQGLEGILRSDARAVGVMPFNAPYTLKACIVVVILL